MKPPSLRLECKGRENEKKYKFNYTINFLKEEMRIKVACYKYAKKINMILSRRKVFKEKGYELKQAIKLLEKNQ